MILLSACSADLECTVVSTRCPVSERRIAFLIPSKSLISPKRSDQLRPKVLAKHADEVLVKIRGWLGSEHPYTVRYAIGLLMTNYLDEEFEPGLLQLVAEIDREHYYIQMMQAWYFATALAKQPASTLPLIESQTLTPFVQNKTIQKARESKRISPELKKALLAWKITEKGKD